jgi:hypothetical protein
MVNKRGDRFTRIMALTPRRFHISATPPFAEPYDDSLVLCGNVNEGKEDGSVFGNQRSGIKNCKPGIWTSRILPVSKAFRMESYQPEDGEFEVLIYWVSEGEIDMSQSVEEWETYEERTRQSDAAVELTTLFPKDTKWKRAGSYYDDGGVCSIITTDFLTRDAAGKIMGLDVDDEEFNLGFYFETLTLNGWEASTDGKNAGFTLGGMNCEFELIPQT